MYANQEKIQGGIYPQPECSISAPVNKFGTGPVGKESTIDQLIQLRENVSTLHEMLTLLEQKLNPIRNFSPTCCEKEMEKPRNGSELRQSLADQNDRLGVLRYRLNGLMEEIDL